MMTSRCGIRPALVALVLSLGHQSAQALNPNLAITQYTHRLWQTEQGLPQSSVFAILQTRDGYLWLATQEGLVRFDGARFTVFNKQNTEAIRHNDVWNLLEDSEGTLWIGTRGGGLVRYRDGRFDTLSKEDGLTSDSVQALWQGRDGGLWIGTRGGGLNRYKDGVIRAYTAADGLSSKTIYAIVGDRDGNLWLGTDGEGLVRYRNGKFDTLSKAQGILNDTIYAILEDFEGDLWVGSGKGLFRLHDGVATAFGPKDGLLNDNIRAIYQDRQGTLWLGTDGGGLYRYRAGRFTAFGAKQGLSNDNVGALFEDREGSLWIGTDAGGLNRLRDNTFVTYSSDEGLPNDNVRAVLEDRAGAMWIGSFGGLTRWFDGKFTTLTKRQGLSSDAVLSLMEDRSGALWAGTLGGGLNRYRNGLITHFSDAQGLSNETVLCLLEDADGVVWAGTRSGGLNRLEGERFKALTTADGLGSNDVRVLLNARRGGFWIGTLGGGLNHYQDGKITTYNTSHGLAHDLVLSLYEDKDGVLWIGTFGGGLSRFKGGKFTTVTSKNGLYDDVVYRILEDDGGNLWMSSNRGISRVSKRDLDGFADGKRLRVESVAYGSADGMKSGEANGAHQPAGWRSRDGRLWFPTVRGVVSVDPNRLQSNQVAPPIRIEEVMIGSERAVVDTVGDSPVQVPPGRQKLEFHYTALSFLAPEKVRFKVRLEGYDEAWVDAGNNRVATYTNLPPGNYRFLVRASNNDGVWNEIGAELSLEIQPRFYQRGAFYLVYLLLIAGVVALATRFYRARVDALKHREQVLLELIQDNASAEDALRAANATLEQRNQELARSNSELERFVYVASHDLKEPLRSVVSFTQLLAKKYQGRMDADADQYIQYAVNGALSMQSHIENLINYARAGKLEKQLARASFEVGLQRALAHLDQAIERSGAVVTHDPLPDLRAHPTEVIQLFQNLVGNAIKFRGAAPPRVHVGAALDAVRSQWQFTVSDNGIGIDPPNHERIFNLFERLDREPDDTGTGIGLALCKKIVEGRGGRIWVESEPGKGSRFHFTLPE